MHTTPLHQILTLARAGNPARAWSLFRASGWDARTDDPKALTLKGRLLKDQGKLTSGAERVRLYGDAAAAYAAAGALEHRSYPLINAATLALLGGQPERAAQLARQVLEMLESNPDEAETAYWRAATRSEALLLLGKPAEARAALRDAMAKAPKAWEDHAATLGQFALIAAQQGEDSSWLDQHRPPVSLHFSGIIGLPETDSSLSSDITDMIARERPGFAYGALAAGADILLAEALVESGCELHIVLPFDLERFKRLSLEPYGAYWLPRFDRLMEQAASIENLGHDDPAFAPAINLTARYAMGRALRNAANLQSSAKAVTVIGKGEQPCPQSAAWQAAGRALIVIEAERTGDGGSSSAPEAKDGQALRAVLVDANDDAPSEMFETIQAAYETALPLANRGQKLGLIYDIMAADNPPARLLAQGKALAEVSEVGTIMTDAKGAMGMTLANCAKSIEEIGELKTAAGAIPLWSIS